jgi:tetratricopeptide (TPR) repeat protein
MARDHMPENARRRTECASKARSRSRLGADVIAALAVCAMLIMPQHATAYVRPVEYRWLTQQIRLHAERHPERMDGYLMSCMMFLSIHLPQPALEACNHAVDSVPHSPLALKLRGGIFLQAGEFERAQVDFSLAVALQPRDGEALDLRGRSLAALGRYGEALADLNQAVRLDPRNTDALEDRGSVYQATGHYDAAIGDFSTSIGVDSGDPTAWNGRCWARMLADKQLEAALSDCNRALKLAPGRDDILDSLGWVYLRLGRTQTAVARFDAALAQSPRLASSLFGRGMARLELGDIRNGRADIKLATELEPGIEARFKGYGIVPREHHPQPVPKSRPTTEQAS